MEKFRYKFYDLTYLGNIDNIFLNSKNQNFAIFEEIRIPIFPRKIKIRLLKKK